MLSILNTKTKLSSFVNTKCAEIYFQTVNNFSIICTYCDLKSFEFNDFLLHFKNVHLDGTTALIVEKDKIEEAHNECILSFESKEQISYSKYGKESLDNTREQDEVYKLESNNESSSASDLDNDNSQDYELKPKVLERSKNSNSSNKLKCTECEKTYKLPKSLAYHKIKCHSKKALLKCSSCECKFSEERALNKHVRTAHVKFFCDQCPKVFNGIRAFKYHKTAHEGVLNYVCNFENCGKAFFHQYRLNAHRKFAHSQERKYVCEICGFGLKSKQALDVHTRSHTGEKPFACNECDRRFASSSQLAEHKAMHSSEKPHICNVCSTAFARPKALYHHKHLHLAVKKFVCKICGKAYAQASGLCGHMKQHKAEKLLCKK